MHEAPILVQNSNDSIASSDFSFFNRIEAGL